MGIPILKNCYDRQIRHVIVSRLQSEERKVRSSTIIVVLPVGATIKDEDEWIAVNIVAENVRGRSSK